MTVRRCAYSRRAAHSLATSCAQGTRRACTATCSHCGPSARRRPDMPSQL
jgi:hypothetical protein